tara:strand:- start:1041 stop:1457 length:417 start_codon:yes stop_codon:yes gene_type:complete
MTFELERKNIEEEFAGTWNSTTTPVAYSNIRGIVSGTSILKNSTGLDEWARLEIVNASSDNAVIGGSSVQHVGTIVVNIFVKSGTGTDRARELADTVRGIFNNASFDGIQCEATYLTTVGDIEGFYQLSVVTPYSRRQ